MFCLAVCKFARPRGEGDRLFLQVFFHPRERHPKSILFDHEEETDQPHGENTCFLRPCAASGDYKRMPLVSFNFLHTTGRSASRVFVISARLLPRRRKPCTNRNQAATVACCVRCVKLRKSRIKNQSHRLFHKRNLFCLYLVSRDRGLQMLHSFVAPTLFPRRDPLRLAGNARRQEKHVPRRGSEGRNTKK